MTYTMHTYFFPYAYVDLFLFGFGLTVACKLHSLLVE